MPREQINEVQLDRDPVPDPLAPVTDDASVQVAWLAAHNVDEEQNGHVQVCLEVDVSYAQFAAKVPNGSRADRTQLYTPVLTRAEINKLIRTLKRARDAAYGQDE